MLFLYLLTFQVGFKSLTAEALTCELAGQYSQAANHYAIAISRQAEEWSDGVIIESEADLWEDFRGMLMHF